MKMEKAKAVANQEILKAAQNSLSRFMHLLAQPLFWEKT
jgi:hypothetical protein